MKSELEKLISSNRSAFDTESPPEGHLERFSSMLSEAGANQSGRKRKLYRQSVLRIAALAAVVTLAIMLIKPLGEGPTEIDPQFAQAADYFAGQLRSKAEEIKTLAGFIEAGYRTEVIADIDMLSELNLEQIPQGMISEEEKIGLLFEHYQAKSSSLEMIEHSLSNIIGPAAD